MANIIPSALKYQARPDFHKPITVGQAYTTNVYLYITVIMNGMCPYIGKMLSPYILYLLYKCLGYCIL